MGVISNDLIQFKQKVEPQIGAMNSKCSEISSTIQNVINVTNSAQTSFDSYYKSQNKPTVLSSMNSLNSKYNTINSSVEGTLKGMISGAADIVSQVNKLETINSEIDNLRSIVNSCTKDEDKDRKSSAQSKINAKEQEFTTLHNEALAALASLKSKDESLETEKDYDEVEGMDTSNLKYGSFTTKEYVVNGQKIKCYVYVPDYGEEVQNLPVMMYMHGASMENTGEQIVTYNGLGQLINERKITPSGIVVIPYVQNGHLYENKAYRDALAQIPNVVADEYHGDKSRISLAGTSYGGVTAYRLVNEHPDTFSAVVTACGAEEVTNAFEGMKVINYSGRGDPSNHTGKTYVKKQTDKINQVGGKAEFHMYDNQWAHGNVGTLAFQEQVTDEQGNKIPVVEWLFRQKKA